MTSCYCLLPARMEVLKSSSIVFGLDFRYDSFWSCRLGVCQIRELSNRSHLVSQRNNSLHFYQVKCQGVDDSLQNSISTESKWKEKLAAVNENSNRMRMQSLQVHEEYKKQQATLQREKLQVPENSYLLKDLEFIPYLTDEGLISDISAYDAKASVYAVFDETKILQYVGISRQCLLVKGWKSGASWSFPRGKKAKDEEDHKCAIREVFEETGFDVSKLLNVDDNIEVIIGQQRVRLYIIGGVKDDTVFAPQTKKEISDIQWFRVDELQPTNNEANSRGPNGMKCFMVGPFIGPLKEWIPAHCLPATSKSDGSLKGSGPAPGIGSPTDAHVSNVPVMEPYQSTTGVINEDLPGKSFRNFRFDSSFILRLLDGTFISGGT